jgi:hypothetical protein
MPNQPTASTRPEKWASVVQCRLPLHHPCTPGEERVRIVVSLDQPLQSAQQPPGSAARLAVSVVCAVRIVWAVGRRRALWAVGWPLMTVGVTTFLALSRRTARLALCLCVSLYLSLCLPSLQQLHSCNHAHRSAARLALAVVCALCDLALCAVGVCSLVATTSLLALDRRTATVFAVLLFLSVKIVWTALCLSRCLPSPRSALGAWRLALLCALPFALCDLSSALCAGRFVLDGAAVGSRTLTVLAVDRTLCAVGRTLSVGAVATTVFAVGRRTLTVMAVGRALCAVGRTLTVGVCCCLTWGPVGLCLDLCFLKIVSARLPDCLRLERSSPSFGSPHSSPIRSRERRPKVNTLWQAEAPGAISSAVEPRPCPRCRKWRR